MRLRRDLLHLGRNLLGQQLGSGETALGALVLLVVVLLVRVDLGAGELGLAVGGSSSLASGRLGGDARVGSALGLFLLVGLVLGQALGDGDGTAVQLALVQLERHLHGGGVLEGHEGGALAALLGLDGAHVVDFAAALEGLVQLLVGGGCIGGGKNVQVSVFGEDKTNNNTNNAHK